MDQWQFIAERKIREAMEEGAFDHLEGTGEPLDLSENPFEDPSLRLAHRLLKSNGFAPAWVEESKEIEAEARFLSKPSYLSADERRRRAEALNRRIEVYNLKAPHFSLHKPLFPLDP